VASNRTTIPQFIAVCGGWLWPNRRRQPETMRASFWPQPSGRHPI